MIKNSNRLFGNRVFAKGLCFWFLKDNSADKRILKICLPRFDIFIKNGGRYRYE